MATRPAIIGSTLRLGNFRLGYQPAALQTVRTTRVRIFLNGTLATARVRRDSLSIRDVLNDAPNTCQLVIDGTPAPETGMALRITINSNSPRLLFSGSIQVDDVTYEGKPAQVCYPCSAIDDTAFANARLPFGTWTNMSATTVAQELVATFAPTLTTHGVQASLPAISVKFDGTEGMNGAFRQIAKLIGGYFYWDDGDLHLFQTEATDAPDTLDSTPNRFLDKPPIRSTSEDSQIRTRVYGKGHGEPTLDDVAVGASVLPVQSARAWFNGSGGKAIYDTHIVTYTGFAWRANLTDWTPVGVQGSAQAAGSIVWSPELALFAAAFNSGVVKTSPDGVTWTLRTTSAGQLSGIAWAPALSLFAAVGTTGVQIVTSPTGETWTARTAPAANAWVSIAWSPSLALFAAVASTGANRVMVSSDGVTWTGYTGTASNGAWTAIAWSPSLGLFVAVASVGTDRVMTSANGTAWTAQTPSASVEWTAIAWSPELALFAAVASTTGDVMTSANGTAWTGRTAPSGDWRAITWAADVGLFVVVSATGTGMVSANGIDWVAVNISTGPLLAAVAWAPVLGRFIAGGAGGRLLLNQSDSTLTGVAPPPAQAIVNGTMVHLWVQRDDLTAQAELAARASTPTRVHDGIVEHLLSDERRGEASLTALCDADLALFSRPLVTVAYATRDVKTKSGKPIVVNLASPAISETLTIQEVTITEIDVAPGVAPRFTTEASSVRFSLEDMLRRMSALVPE